MHYLIHMRHVKEPVLCILSTVAVIKFEHNRFNNITHPLIAKRAYSYHDRFLGNMLYSPSGFSYLVQSCKRPQKCTSRASLLYFVEAILRSLANFWFSILKSPIEDFSEMSISDARTKLKTYRTNFLMPVRSADPADRRCDRRTDMHIKGALGLLVAN